jgi:hypothetical protein
VTSTISTVPVVAETGQVQAYYTSSSRKSVKNSGGRTDKLGLTVYDVAVTKGVTIGTIKDEIRRRHIVFNDSSLDTKIAPQVYSGRRCDIIENEPSDGEQYEYELLPDHAQWDVEHHGGNKIHPLIVEVAAVERAASDEDEDDIDEDDIDEDEDDIDEDVSKLINRDTAYPVCDDEKLISFGNDKDWIIAKQIIRAIDHWEKAVQMDNTLESMSDQIIPLLKKGNVPPYFHAFSAGKENYLFPIGTKVSTRKTNSGEITQVST